MDYVSDLHLDNCAVGGPHGNFATSFDFERRKNAGSDVLIVAGDTGEYSDDCYDFLNAARSHYRLVVGVLGNHERGPLTKAVAPGVHVLDNAPGFRVDDGPRVFVGACLAAGDDAQAAAVQAAVEQVYAEGVAEHVIIVMHFAPFVDLTAIVGQPITDKCNGFIAHLPYVPPIPTTIVFGHLHIEVDTVVNGYRLVSNPRGYRSLRRDGSAFRGLSQLV